MRRFVRCAPRSALLGSGAKQPRVLDLVQRAGEIGRRGELPTSSSDLASASYGASRPERRYRAVDPDNAGLLLARSNANGKKPGRGTRAATAVQEQPGGRVRSMRGNGLATRRGAQPFPFPANWICFRAEAAWKRYLETWQPLPMEGPQMTPDWHERSRFSALPARLTRDVKWPPASQAAERKHRATISRRRT
jgi:hypothetical protein